MKQTSVPVLDQAVDASPPARMKPRWRGVSHQYAFFAAILAGLPLVLAAPTTRASVAAAIYVASLAGLLGTSALYHRIMWQPRARFWMAQIDVSMIFVLIAGSFTPVVLLTLQPRSANRAFWVVWGMAAVGIAVKFLLRNSRKSTSSILFATMSSMGALLLLPEIVGGLGFAALAMFAASGALYLLGALVYGLQRPDPLPSVFGYHEIFHALVVVAATIHFVAVAVYVLPA